MKKIRIITAIALLASMVACNPIEDKSLRDDYITNAGTPVTSEELTSYLHVDQPYPNTETAVEGDQIVSLKNDRPEIGGVWHVVTSMGETILKSDSCTYTYESMVSSRCTMSPFPQERLSSRHISRSLSPMSLIRGPAI